MDRKTALRLGLLAWTVAFVLAFVDFSLTQNGEALSLTESAKVRKFLMWQGSAVVIAIYLWRIGGHFPVRSGQRAAARLPGVIAIALLFAVGLVLGTQALVTPQLAG